MSLGDVMFKVQTLLSCDQMAIEYCDISMMYPDEDTFTLDEIVTVCSEDIVRLSCPIPKNIQKVCNHKLIGLNHQVNMYFPVYKLNCVEFFYIPGVL